MTEAVTQPEVKRGDAAIMACSGHPSGALAGDGRDAQGRLLTRPLVADEQGQPLRRRTRFGLDGIRMTESTPRNNALKAAFITASTDEDEVWQAETVGAASRCWKEVSS
jgi:hypothetical protein